MSLQSELSAEQHTRDQYDPSSVVLVFKTGFTSENDFAVVGTVLDSDLSIQQWSVDLEDIDKVLRVVTKDCDPKRIRELVIKSGFACEELN